MEQRNKKIYIEILRIIACFCVIFNHTSYDGFFLFSNYSPLNIKFWIYCGLSIFCKFSVPMFFTISGALLLNKEESMKTVFTKRVLKNVISLVFFSFVYYYFFNVLYNINHISFDNIQSFFVSIFTIINISFENIFDCLIKIYSNTVTTHLWFMYSYIAFLVALPVLRILVKKMDNKHFAYIALLALIFDGIIPILDFLIWKGQYSLSSTIKPGWLITSIVLYPCLGYYFENRLEIKEAKKYIPILWVTNIITVVLSCAMTVYQYKLTGIIDEETSQTFFSSFTIINLITVYITIKFLSLSYKDRRLKTKIILTMGECSYGVYQLHQIVIILLNRYLVDFSKMLFNDMFAELVSCVLILIIYIIITYILKQIPIIKKVL